MILFKNVLKFSPAHFAVLSALCWTCPAFANDWDANGAAQPGNGLWNTAANWSTDVVPVLGEQVFIGTATYPNSTVTLSGVNGNSGLTRIANVAGTAELIIDGVTLTANSQFGAGVSNVAGSNARVHLKNNAVVQGHLGAAFNGSTATFTLDSGTKLISLVQANLGDGNGAYTINMAGNAILQFDASPNLRLSTTATGEIRGTGFITTAGALRPDARFIADGGTLDLHFVGSGLYLTNIVPTQGTGDPSGYYAINGGKVVLGGSLAWGQLGSGTNNSGPRSEGSTLDLDPSRINAVQFRNIAPTTNVTNPATVDTEILALNLVSGLSGVVSAWNIDNKDSFITTATGIQIRFRYNDLGLAAGPESTLKLFQNLGSGWSLVPGSVLSTSDNWITSGNLLYNLSDAQTNSMGMFAVAQAIEAADVPEPGTFALGLLGLVGFGLFVWRKRK